MLETDTSFLDLGAGRDLSEALASDGIVSPSPIQDQAIPPLLEGRDVIGQARTGSGKTLAFGVPMLLRADPNSRGAQALVLVPTRELAIQVASVLDPLARRLRLWLALLYGGRPLPPETEELRNGAQVIIGTPGRVLDHLWQGNLPVQDIRMLVLDEADEMLDQGFAPDIEKIISLLPRERQTALFSATVPSWVVETSRRHMKDPVHIRVDDARVAVPEIEQMVFEVPAGGKLDVLCTLLDRRDDEPVLIFGRTKLGVERLARDLRRKGYPVAGLQGNLDQAARERIMAAFRSGDTPILVATNVAARGLDVTGIEAVIHFDVPESAEMFIHRSGRTGRMGREGLSITLLAPEDLYLWRRVEHGLGRSISRQRWPGGEPVAPEPRQEGAFDPAVGRRAGRPRRSFRRPARATRAG